MDTNTKAALAVGTGFVLFLLVFVLVHSFGLGPLGASPKRQQTGPRRVERAAGQSDKPCGPSPVDLALVALAVTARLGKPKAALHGALGAAAVEQLAGPLGHVFGVGDVPVLVLEPGQVAPFDLGADQALDGLELVHVFGGEQNDGLAAGAGARRAADAVDVVLGLRSGGRS